jgi:HK97 family phage portal protein
MGSDNTPLYSLVDTAEAVQQGIAQSVKNGTSLRGILKFTSLKNPEQVKAEKEEFVKDYFSLDNKGGIAAVDMKSEFVPVSQQPYQIPRDQVETTFEQIHRYLGVSSKIIDGSYSEDEFQAFYESTLEPFALQLSQEFTRKTKTRIEFTSERLEFTSTATRIKLLHEVAPLGLMSINEGRALFMLPPVDDGDKRLQSLNYVQTDKANEYQIESEA